MKLRRYLEAVVSEWLPIDTAPLDGTEIDLWMVDEDGKGWRVPNARYVRNYSFDKHEWTGTEFREFRTIWSGGKRDGWFAPNHGYDGEDGWCDVPRYFNPHPRQNREIFTLPTHWMPIPEPPA